MTFELKGVRCARNENVISYEGLITHFKQGEVFNIGTEVFQVEKIEMSPFVSRYSNMTIKKVN